MLKKLLIFSGILVFFGGLFYQNCAKVNFSADSLDAAAVTPTSSFALAVTGGGLSAPSSSFTAVIGQTYDFQITGSSDEMSAGLNNSQSFFKKVSGQCSGNSIYQPLTLDLTQAGTTLMFGDNSFAYNQNIANALGGCVWQVCAQSALGTQSCVNMTASLTSTTTTTSPTATTLKTVTTLPTATTMVTPTTMKPVTTTMAAPPPTSPPSTVPPTAQPAACNFNGQIIASGGSVTGFQTSSVGYGHTCTSQTRTCTNGTLSGSYGFSSCTVNPTPDCAPATVSLIYYCDDTNNNCGEVSPIGYRVPASQDQESLVTDAVYRPQKNDKEFLTKVLFFGGQCPASMPGGATGDVQNVTLKPYQIGAGGQARVVCQNGQWTITSGDCAGNYGLCFYPKQGNNWVCTPQTKPNSI